MTREGWSDRRGSRSRAAPTRHTLLAEHDRVYFANPWSPSGSRMCAPWSGVRRFRTASLLSTHSLVSRTRGDLGGDAMSRVPCFLRSAAKCSTRGSLGLGACEDYASGACAPGSRRRHRPHRPLPTSSARPSTDSLRGPTPALGVIAEGPLSGGAVRPPAGQATPGHRRSARKRATGPS